MTVTEQELKFATDIAYLDLELLNENMPQRKDPYSVGELLNVKTDGNSKEEKIKAV